MRYGFEPKTSNSANRNKSNMNTNDSESSETQSSSSKVSSSSVKRVVHFWDLITKYFEHEMTSVEFINYYFEDKKNAIEFKEMEESQNLHIDLNNITVSSHEKATAWLILALNEDYHLYECLKNIFNNGSFLSYYKQKSFLLSNKKEVLAMVDKIYRNNLYLNSDIYSKF